MTLRVQPAHDFGPDVLCDHGIPRGELLETWTTAKKLGGVDGYSTPMLADVERQFVEAWVRSELRERYSLLLGGKQRKKQLNRLYHHFDFIAAKTRKLAVRESDERSVLGLMPAGAAQGRCHVLSVNDEIDGSDMNFEEWLKTASWIPPGSIFFWPSTTTALIRTEHDFYLLTKS